MFDFVVEDTQEKPTVTFTGEEPYLQYVSDHVHCITWNSYVNIPSLSLLFYFRTFL